MKKDAWREQVPYLYVWAQCAGMDWTWGGEHFLTIGLSVGPTLPCSIVVLIPPGFWERSGRNAPAPGERGTVPFFFDGSAEACMVT